ncbi:MAG: molybdenum ABC transporter ATP-binding protein [Betaproteobacteria bacterium]|nr:molybdenum ABC transporter ATP-binding protein [Betaproteobacteria bacterium]
MIQGAFDLARERFALQAKFEVPARGVTALFGPSGSGKTTLLRCLAGFERSPAGFLSVAGAVWQDEARRVFLPVHKRPLGYVFQDARLFPHLCVRDNLRFAWRRTPGAERALEMDQVIDWLGLEPLLDRREPRLSGGEKQRVAIARALLASPRLLLMDEPLAALDAAAKGEILPYLEALHRRLSIPIVYVSHSLEEVSRLADHVLLMAEGRVEASGPLQELATCPDSPLAHLEDAATVIDGVVAEHDNTFHLTYVDFAGGRLSLSRNPLPVGTAVRVRILARDVSLALSRAPDTSILNILEGTIETLAGHSPAQLLVHIALAPGSRMLARITRKSASLLALHAGQRVFAQVKSVALVP